MWQYAATESISSEKTSSSCILLVLLIELHRYRFHNEVAEVMGSLTSDYSPGFACNVP
jgi:hypothetical protein